MAMRETEGSLRAWLAVMGVLGILTGVAMTAGDWDVDRNLVEGGVMLYGAITVLTIVTGVGYLIAACNLRDDLPTGAVGTQWLLMGALGLLILELVVGNLVAETAAGPFEIGFVVIGITVTSYVLRELRRLADEASHRAKPEAPVARVI